MHTDRRNTFAILGVGATLLTTPAASSAQLLGPTPYLSFNNSPFSGTDFSYFYLENFEDGLFNVPGVTASAGGVTSVVFGPTAHDSVDADDGVIDGSGLNGDSYYSANARAGITFTFNPAVLGNLPTHVGLVWTGGTNNIVFEAFDASNTSLGTLTGSHASGNFFGPTAEDRFYGIVNTGGISSVRILSGTIGSGGIEVDHLQYGRLPQPNEVIPEPSSCALVAIGLLPLLGVTARRRKQRADRLVIVPSASGISAVAARSRSDTFL